MTAANTLESKYLYQGKEMQDELGLDLLDFGARNYDPQIGRFVSTDPMEQYVSGYIGMGDDPANLIDPSGMDAHGSAPPVSNNTNNARGAEMRRNQDVEAESEIEQELRFDMYLASNGWLDVYVTYANGTVVANLGLTNYNNQVAAASTPNGPNISNLSAEEVNRRVNAKDGDPDKLPVGSYYRDVTGVIFAYGGDGSGFQIWGNGTSDAEAAQAAGTTKDEDPNENYDKFGKDNFYATGVAVAMDKGGEALRFSRIASAGRGIGYVAGAAGTFVDGYGVYNYHKYGPDSKEHYTVSYGKVGLNLAMTLYGFTLVGTIPSIIYFAGDALFPGGWFGNDKDPGFFNSEATFQEELNDINGYGPNRVELIPRFAQ